MHSEQLLEKVVQAVVAIRYEAINDQALAAWAKRKAAELRATKEALPGS